jgi:hypothetical protein
MSSRQPLTQRQPRELDKAYTTSFRLKYEARQHLRARPRRVMIFLFVAAFLSVILFSQQHPFSADYVRHDEGPLDSQTLFASDLYESLPLPPNTVVTASPSMHTVVVEPHVEPVVFALVMYSESSAKEGAILLKVYFPGSTYGPFLG